MIEAFAVSPIGFPTLVGVLVAPLFGYYMVFRDLGEWTDLSCLGYIVFFFGSAITQIEVYYTTKLSLFGTVSMLSGALLMLVGVSKNYREVSSEHE